MAAGCVRLVLCHAVKTVYGGTFGYRTATARTLISNEKTFIFASARRWSSLDTEADDTNPAPQKKKKQDPRARTTISSVGRKIPHREIRVISEAGENLGVMHRGDVIRLMDEKGLKLVLLGEHQDPPVYRLMSGRQIHEEQMKMWEKQKTKAAPVQVKELSFSSGIASHDLTVKLKQVETWLEKKHHVKITLRVGRNTPTSNPDDNLQKIVEQMEVMVGFVSKPKVIRDGQAAMCVLRPPSAKELSKNQKDRTSLPQSDSSQPNKDELSPPVIKEESLQQ
uniref:translation initiation factor IF-3, mitochondrial n=1 Tax=Doryrhamphus excisus TaxID=161450 RepID=UPI0025ADB099|nr:translation initiation factor IF-3, mitochondrial [Doryrhamphus excisus]XP_057913858.1 translation initiation factor IF-3, mitochondrial [Doryrhamphus excisus]XP_057913859.1 translation initiation factor IF-3, mitochondrial [Doryrhamphus excisus]